MLSRNDFIYKPCAEVDTLTSEAMLHKMYANDDIIPIDYLMIYTYQRDDSELKENREKTGTKYNYKQKCFGKVDLWTKSQIMTTNGEFGFLMN